MRVPFAEGVDVPLYILGSSTDSAHLAARKGLPYAFAAHFAPAQLLQALDIYYNEFQPSQALAEPYAIACINIVAAESEREAEGLFTSLLRMFLNILTGRSDYLQAPTELTQEVSELWHHPNVQQMLKYTFVGSKELVKKETEAFIAQTGVQELMVVSNMYGQEDRLKSYSIFSEIMQELGTNRAAASQR